MVVVESFSNSIIQQMQSYAVLKKTVEENFKELGLICHNMAEKSEQVNPLQIHMSLKQIDDQSKQVCSAIIAGNKEFHDFMQAQSKHNEITEILNQKIFKLEDKFEEKEKECQALRSDIKSSEATLRETEQLSLDRERKLDGIKLLVESKESELTKSRELLSKAKAEVGKYKQEAFKLKEENERINKMQEESGIEQERLIQQELQQQRFLQNKCDEANESLKLQLKSMSSLKNKFEAVSRELSETRAKLKNCELELAIYEENREQTKLALLESNKKSQMEVKDLKSRYEELVRKSDILWNNKKEKEKVPVHSQQTTKPLPESKNENGADSDVFDITSSPSKISPKTAYKKRTQPKRKLLIETPEKIIKRRR